MPTSPLKKDNLVFSSASDVRSLCAPLFDHFDIGNFTYLKIFPDMSRVHLDTDAAFTEIFYQNIEEYSKAYLTESNHWESGYSSLLALDDSCIKDCIANGVGEGVVLTKRYDDCTEVVYITHDWEKHRRTKLDLLLRNIDLLQLFLDYFREEARDLISESARDPILCSFMKAEEIKAFSTNTHAREGFSIELNGLMNKKRLTVREKECIHYTSLDMSAKEVALQLGISFKTVERHLENAKKKCGCRKKTSLIKYCSNLILE